MRRARARTSSCCEQKGVEVLLLGDRIDEWVMGQVTEFEGKRFKDVARGDLELGGLADQAERARIDEERKENKALLKRFKDALGDRVLEVRVSERLRDSPAVPGARRGRAVGADAAHARSRRPDAAGRAAGARAQRDASAGAPHGQRSRSREEFQELALLLYDQASLTEEGQVGNPADFSRRLNSLLVRLVTPPSDRSVCRLRRPGAEASDAVAPLELS